MISLEEVEKTILELESKDTSYAVCEKLAYLYIVRDHIKPSGSIQKNTGSEFSRSISGKDSAGVLSIIEELMQTISIVHPKLYQSTINALKQL